MAIIQTDPFLNDLAHCTQKMKLSIIRTSSVNVTKTRSLWEFGHINRRNL